MTQEAIGRGSPPTVAIAATPFFGSRAVWRGHVRQRSDIAHRPEAVGGRVESMTRRTGRRLDSAVAVPFLSHGYGPIYRPGGVLPMRTNRGRLLMCDACMESKRGAG